MEKEKPKFDPEEYYKSWGMYDLLKKAGKTIRFTHSLEVMKRQQEEVWNEYKQKFIEQAEKVGNKVEDSDFKIIRNHFLQKEIKYFTAILEGSQSDYEINEKAVVHKYLNELKEELDQMKAGKKKEGKESLLWTKHSNSQKILVALFHTLNDAGYINSTQETFEAVFGDEIINCQSVQWTNSNRLLAYLFDLMYMNNFIEQGEWQNVISKYRLFKNKKGNYFTNGDLSEALSWVKKLKLSGDYQKIYEVIENLESLRA